MRIIQVVLFNREWETKYRDEKKILLRIFTQNVIKIHHIGSTSINGLSAKPIIDMMIEVKNLEEIDLKNKEMVKIANDPKQSFNFLQVFLV